MGEAVAHRTGQLAPLGNERRRAGGRRAPSALAPVGRGKLHHAAQQAAFGPAAQQHVVAPRGPEHHAVARRARRLGRLAGQGFLDAGGARKTRIVPRARAAVGAARRAHGGAEIHQRLGEVAGAAARGEVRGGLGDLGLGAGQRRLDAPQPRHHPLDVAVDRGRLAAERDRRDRGGGIGADAGQGEEPVLVVGKDAGHLPAHVTRAGMHVARPGVIAEPLPGMQHPVEIGGGKLVYGGPAFDEAAEVGTDRRHRGLLQHDLAEPDAIRIGPFARRRAPRQVAAPTIVPGEQPFSQ